MEVFYLCRKECKRDTLKKLKKNTVEFQLQDGNF